MEILVSVIVSLVSKGLALLQLLLFARAILSWLPFDDSSVLYRFLYYTTEPIILPIRNVLDRVEFLSRLPIDLSFIIAYMLLVIVSSLLPAVQF